MTQRAVRLTRLAGLAVLLCLAVGMNAHCSKPIDIEKLMKIIGKYLK